MRLAAKLGVLSRDGLQAGRQAIFADDEIWVQLGSITLPANLKCKSSYAAAFRLLIRVCAGLDARGVLWSLSSPRRKLISPPTRMAKPER